MRVVTFYSYKGGVGRTQALVNVAASLEREGKRVLLVDFDLEAPGLDAIRGLKFEAGPGIVELIHEYLATGVSPDIQQFVREAQFVDPVSREVPLEWVRLQPGPGALLVLPSGDRSEEARYKRHLAGIDFAQLYGQRDGFLLFEDIRCQWRDRLQVDYVLIDSRTGHTDVGGICVRQLPDHVVLMFYPNEQNLQGIVSIAAEARADARGLEIDAVMSRVPFLDDYENSLRDFEVRARRELKVPRVYRVHSYDSIRIVRDEVFLAHTSLDDSRLSKEYRGIVRAIVTRNLSDRSGLLHALERGLVRAKSVVGSPRLDSWISAVRARYRGDDAVLEALAKALRRDGRDALESEVRMDLAKILTTSDAAKAAVEADSLEQMDPARAAYLAARALDAGDGLALSRRLGAFALLCRLDGDAASAHASLISRLPVEQDWVDANWDSLSRARGGLLVARAAYVRAGLKPRFGPGEQQDGLDASWFWTYQNSGDYVERESRLALSEVALGPMTPEMWEYIDDRLCENQTLRTRGIHALPRAPFRSAAEFGLFLRMFHAQPLGAIPALITEVREQVGVRNAEEFHGVDGAPEFQAVTLTASLEAGVPDDAPLDVQVMMSIEQALYHDTRFAERTLARIGVLRDDLRAKGEPEPWVFNCWQMLNRPLSELERDLREVLLRSKESDERAGSGAGVDIVPAFLRAESEDGSEP
jgi:MinD-like ATPase involved in chromosome partitioning or flagellar assembly